MSVINAALIVGAGWLGLPLAEALKRKNFKLGLTVSSEDKSLILSSLGWDSYAWKLPFGTPPVLGFKPDVLIYTIPPRASVETATQNIQNAIEYARNLGVKNAIYISSTSVYPDENREVVEEDAAYQASPHSGIAVKALEDLWLASAVNTTVLRFGGLYGPGRNPGNFFRNGIASNPSGMINMTHLNDAIEAISRILELQVFGEVLNCVSVNNKTRQAFYSEFNPDLSWEERTHSAFKVVSNQKINRLLGLRLPE